MAVQRPRPRRRGPNAPYACLGWTRPLWDTPPRLDRLKNTKEDSVDENRKKALAAALGQIERQFGKGAVMRMGDVVGQADLLAALLRFAAERTAGPTR